MELQQTEVKNGKEGLHINVAQMCVTAVLMALTCVATMVVQIPIPLGYAHLGDSVILISAYFFGPVVGALAGGIGSAMADILTGYARIRWRSIRSTSRTARPRCRRSTHG